MKVLYRDALLFKQLLLCGLIAVLTGGIVPQANGQASLETNVQTERILFIFDGSGSMKGDWEGKKKISEAKRILTDVIDSIYRTNQNVEFGIRIFGHQYPKSEKNCKDSKLEVDFSADNTEEIKKSLESVTPQGQTPIAYSIFQALDDFPKDPKAKNSIVLITDGKENCGGDLCKAGRALLKERISLKPFIIGVGMDKADSTVFDCAGEFYSVITKREFKKTLKVVTSQAMGKTTTQVYLLNQYGEPKETNVAMTFHDAYSHDIRHNYIHTMDKNGIPDTLYLSPTGKFDLTVHTVPPVHKKNIELIPGKHNIIPVDAPQGGLNIETQPEPKGKTGIRCMIHKPGQRKTLAIQDANTRRRYIVGKYKVEILTLPRLTRTVQIQQDKTINIDIPLPGRLKVLTKQPGIGSIYRIKNNKLEKIHEIYNLKEPVTVKILPGKYKFVYRQERAHDMEVTKDKIFTIDSEELKKIRF